MSLEQEYITAAVAAAKVTQPQEPVVLVVVEQLPPVVKELQELQEPVAAPARADYNHYLVQLAEPVW
jgi:hypothetical protein